MPEIEADDPPQTLPLDFFDKLNPPAGNQQQPAGNQQQVPATLPLNFFDQPPTPPPGQQTGQPDINPIQPPDESDPVENFKRQHPWSQVPINLFQGAGSGVLGTLRNIDELGNRLAPDVFAPSEIPESYTKGPPGWAGTLGHWGEQLGEFFLPAGKVGEVNKAIDASLTAGPWVKAGAKAVVEATPAYAITLAQTGDPAAARNAGLIAGGVSVVLPWIGQALKHTYGAITGVGSDVIERVAEKPSPDLMAAMTGQISEQEILEATRQAVKNVAQKRSADYIAKLNQLDPTLQVDLTPTRRALNDLANQFRIRRILNPQTQKVELDFGNSHLWSDPAAQQQITTLWDKIMSPMAQSPRNVDALKRGVDAMYGESSQARAVVEGVRDKLAETLNRSVPGYQEMTKEYAEASDFLAELKDLSLQAGKTNNDGTAMRKLFTSLKQNNNYRKGLMEELSAYTPKDIVGMVAGNRMSSWVPRGIVAALHASGGLVPGAFLHMAAHDPAALAVSLAGIFGMSPRVVGEIAARSQAGRRLIQTGAGAIPSMLRISNQQPDYDANADRYLPPQKRGGYFKLSSGGVVRMDGGGIMDDPGVFDPNTLDAGESSQQILQNVAKKRQWLQQHGRLPLSNNPGQSQMAKGGAIHMDDGGAYNYDPAGLDPDQSNAQILEGILKRRRQLQQQGQIQLSASPGQFQHPVDPNSIRLGPNAGQLTDPRLANAPPIQVDPDKINLGATPGQIRTPLEQPSARYQTQPDVETREPAKPYVEQIPFNWREPGTDVELGARSGFTGLTNMLMKPGESLYGGDVASGKPLSEAVAEQYGPNQEDLAARQYGLAHQGLQFLGSLPPTIAKYALAGASTGLTGLPAAAASGFIADTLASSGRDSTPEQALTEGAVSGATAILLDVGLSGLGADMTRMGQDVRRAAEIARKSYPSMEAFEAAAARARAQLIKDRAFEPGMTLGSGGGGVGKNLQNVATLMGAKLGVGGYKAAEIATAVGEQVSHLVKQGTLKYAEETPEPAAATAPGGGGAQLPPSAETPSVQKRPAGNDAIAQIANDYNAQNGLPPIDHSQYHPLDENFAGRIADAYELLQADNSGDPHVRAAYEALVRETKAQYDHLVANGYTLEPWTKEGQPYKNSHEMTADLRNNKHLFYFTGGEAHPFMDAVDPATGRTMTEIFRGVHDAYGHAAAGYGFGARGEEGAHDVHSQMYSPLAQQALTTETRGQNSWVNFGRQNYDALGNRLDIPATERPYAEQKVDLLPPEFHIRAGERGLPAAQATPPRTSAEPGMVRLFRGSQSPTRSELSANPPLGEGERGRWFTTDPSATGFYGPHTFYVDVPQAVADAAKEPDTMLGVTGRLIPAEYANKERLYSPPSPATQVSSPAQVTSNAPPLDLENSYIPTGLELGSGQHATGLAAYAREIQIKDYLDQDRRAKLTPQELDSFEKVKAANPEIGAVGDYMNSLEVKKALANPQQVEAMTRMLRVLPQAEQMTATMMAGLPKLGWYRGSAQAISDVFGADAPRFAQLLAATSPRISVEGNLMNALNIWKNWDLAGRPEDPQAILEIMAKSVQGKGKESSVMDAWRNNTYAALTSKDPMSLTLSGPKVDSFQHNLRDHVMQVTNDAWMANAYNISQELFGGQGANPAAGNPGMTPEYAAASARLRQAGAAAGMFPSQGQETIWSVAMQLYEMARKLKKDPRDILQEGLLTPQMINATPDFSAIFRRPDIMKILDDIGKGDEVRALKPFAFPGAQHRISDLTLPQQNLLMDTAGTLSDVMGMRNRESASAKFAPGKGWTAEIPKATSKSAKQQEIRQRMMAGLYPPKGTGTTNIENVPGRVTRHLREINKLKTPGRERFTSAMQAGYQDPQGQDIIQGAALGQQAVMPSKMVQGAYRDPQGRVTSEPGVALPYRANLQWVPRVMDPQSAMPDVGSRPTLDQGAMTGLRTAMPLVGPWKPDLDPQMRANVEGGMAAHAMVGAQEGVGGNVFVPRPEGGLTDIMNMRIPLKDEASEFRMRKLAREFPDYAFPSAGPDIHVLGLGNVISRADADRMVHILKGKQGFVPADAIPLYVQFADEWRQKPGSGQVTTKFFKYADEMSPDAYARLDQKIRQMAGDTEKSYRTYSDRKDTPAREDLMNLLGIVRDGGLEALRAALKRKEFLPGLAAGAVLLPHLLGGGEDSRVQ